MPSVGGAERMIERRGPSSPSVCTRTSTSPRWARVVGIRSGCGRRSGSPNTTAAPAPATSRTTTTSRSSLMAAPPGCRRRIFDRDALAGTEPALDDRVVGIAPLDDHGPPHDAPRSEHVDDILAGAVEHRLGGHEQDVRHALDGHAHRGGHARPQPGIRLLERHAQVEVAGRRPRREVGLRQRADALDARRKLAIGHGLDAHGALVTELQAAALDLVDPG